MAERVVLLVYYNSPIVLRKGSCRLVHELDMCVSVRAGRVERSMAHVLSLDENGVESAGQGLDGSTDGVDARIRMS